MISRRINDPGIIAACHYGNKYETEYSASIETHTGTSIDSAYTRQHMHTDKYDEDNEEERATVYRVILDEEDKLLHHPS
ncbi:hypothetical protein F2Q70_00003775 [Brassica cretica]|uniref:Uncharacterized protein n=1 Tax=Brassica cretica TaxID=69181 RepID=A0A8S9IYU1_BRACR|nr:hypothetical protein F2Q70_00003775 [Brassica cretica]